MDQGCQGLVSPHCHHDRGRLPEDDATDTCRSGRGSGSAGYICTALQTAELVEQRGYDELMRFLTILAADGVERVWFDALCINQADSMEKDREITLMGAYYARSAGCYAWCHGVGGGFELWETLPRFPFYNLPRWFFRVWTLQELVLPSKLAFIVGMDMEGFTAHVAYKALCLTTQLTWHPEELIESNDKQMFMWKPRKFYPCPHCGHQNPNTAIRKVVDGLRSTLTDSGHLYYVARTEYLDLILLSQAEIEGMILSEQRKYEDISAGINSYDTSREWPSERILRTSQLKLTVDDFSSTRQIGKGHPTSCNDSSDNYYDLRMRLTRASQAVQELSQRDCSAGHDEDRLLSILGLIEMEGKMQQLRTGRSLDEQILEVSKALLSRSSSVADCEYRQSLFLLLCLAQYRGTPTVSMSWAPTFRGEKALQEMSRLLMPCKPIAQIVGLPDSSGLKLRCPFLQAKLISVTSHRLSCCGCAACRRVRINDTIDPDIGFNFILEVQDREHFSVFLWVDKLQSDGNLDELRMHSQDITHTCNMVVKAETTKWRLLNSLQLWLLLLAEDNEFEMALKSFMVCVGEDINNLHKVGVFFYNASRPLPPVESSKKWEEELLSMPWGSFTVGGFGPYIPLNLLTFREFFMASGLTKDSSEDSSAS